MHTPKLYIKQVKWYLKCNSCEKECNQSFVLFTADKKGKALSHVYIQLQKKNRKKYEVSKGYLQSALFWNIWAQERRKGVVNGGIKNWFPENGYVFFQPYFVPFCFSNFFRTLARDWEGWLTQSDIWFPGVLASKFTQQQRQRQK